MKKRELIIKTLNSGKTIWRRCESCDISYKKENDYVWRVSHRLDSCCDKKISLIAATNQLTRKFKYVSF